MNVKFDIKNITAILAGLFVLVAFTACTDTDDIAPLSRVTYFPDFILEGEPSYDIACGEQFTLPGTRVEEEGVEIDFTTEITGRFFDVTDGGTRVNTEIPDVYSVTYSAVNADGFPGSSARRVNIQPCNGDLVTSIEGSYKATVLRGGVFSEQYQDLQPIIIADLGDDVYGISHAIGGYYDIGRGIGAGYASYGAKVKANDIPGNDFTAVGEGLFPIWGNIAQISNFTVDAAAKTISYLGTGDFGNGEFTVNLTQIEN